jgi:hypothetical protein
VPATLVVEVLRASGLGAAVREAVAALGGPGSGSTAASSLERAATVGPHAFVRLALGADSEGEPLLHGRSALHSLLPFS